MHRTSRVTRGNPVRRPGAWRPWAAAAGALTLLLGLATGSAALDASRSTLVGESQTLWGSATPTDLEFDQKTAAVELGTKFSPDVDGVVTAIRFWKGAGSRGTHTGSLWTSDGRRLAKVVFSSETRSGWQTATLRTPVPVSADKQYVVSYFAPQGVFAATRYFTGASASPALSATRNSGVYSYGTKSSFPKNSWHRSQYRVDVKFSPGVSAPATATPSASATPTATATPSATPTPTATPSASATPTATPSASATPTASAPSAPSAGSASGSTAVGGFPTRETTGVPAGWTPTKTVTGDYYVDQDNAVVEDLRLTNGVLYVRGDNVTIRRVELIDSRIVNDYNHVCHPLLIEDTSFLRAGNDIGMPAIESGGYTALRVKIDGPSEGFRVGEKDYANCGEVVIQDSWVEADPPDDCTDWHGDTVQGYRGAAVTVRNTSLTLAQTSTCQGTSAFFYPDQENTSVTIDHVLVQGGGYVFRLGTPGSVSGLKIVSDSWDYAPVDVTTCSSLSKWDAEIVTVSADGTPTTVRKAPCTSS